MAQTFKIPVFWEKGLRFFMFKFKYFLKKSVSCAKCFYAILYKHLEHKPRKRKPECYKEKYKAQIMRH